MRYYMTKGIERRHFDSEMNHNWIDTSQQSAIANPNIA